MPKQLTLEEINRLDQESFVRVLSALFEGSPWIVRQARYARPFTSLTQLYEALCQVMDQAPVEQQVALIQAHPDLVGQAALAGTLTPESTIETLLPGAWRPISAYPLPVFRPFC